MDPFSITVGIMTILGAPSQVSKGLKLLTDLRNAPAALLALNNEVAEAQCMVQELHDLARQHQDTIGSVINPSVCRALENIQQTVLVLEQLIAYKLTKVDSRNGQIKLQRRAWLRSENKLRELQEQMRGNRINLAVALNIQNT